MPDPTMVKLTENFSGLPVISTNPCKQDCQLCIQACPTEAIIMSPLTLSLDSCIFCLECQEICPEHKIQFSNEYKMGTNVYERLQINEGISN